MAIQNNRKKGLARRLALWSIADQIDHKSVEQEVNQFSDNCAVEAENLKALDQQIKELQDTKKEIANKIIQSCADNIYRLHEKTTNSVTKPLIDLAFWNRLSDSKPDLYKLINPYLDELGDESLTENKD